MIFIDDLKGSIKKLGFTQGIFYQLMINISANISRDLGMIPGGEFRRAVVEVICHNLFLVWFVSMVCIKKYFFY